MEIQNATAGAADRPRISFDFSQPRVRFNAMRYIGGAIVLLYLATFGLQWLAQTFHGSLLQVIADKVMDALLLDKRFYDGQVWRIVSHMFMHGGFWHMFMNLLNLLVFYAVIRRHFAGYGWFAVYFGGGIIGGFAELYAHPAEQLVGASGGIMALWGAAIAAAIRFRYAPPGERPWQYRIPLTTLLGYLVLQFFLEFTLVSNVGHLAHLGGLVSGFAFGIFLHLAGAPAILASRNDEAVLAQVEFGSSSGVKFNMRVQFELCEDFDPKRDFIVVEWEEIDFRNRRLFSYEVLAGTLPTDGRPRGDMVELATPYTVLLTQKRKGGIIARLRLTPERFAKFIARMKARAPKVSQTGQGEDSSPAAGDPAKPVQAATGSAEGTPKVAAEHKPATTSGDGTATEGGSPSQPTQ